MNFQQSNDIEEPYLQQEIILGMAVGLGMLLMGISDVVGMLLVSLGVLSVAGIYFLRLFYSIKERGEAIQCWFSWLNNGALILAVAGILILMLMNAYHQPVFYTVLAILCVGLLANGILLRYNIRGMMHITAQLRLVIALVILMVFFFL